MMMIKIIKKKKKINNKIKMKIKKKIKKKIKIMINKEKKEEMIQVNQLKLMQMRKKGKKQNHLLLKLLSK